MFDNLKDVKMVETKYNNIFLYHNFDFRDAAQEVIHNTCSEFNVTEFQTSRVEFQNKILSSLQSRLLSDFKTTVRDVQV